ncbi:MAG: thioredoxin [Bacilli bacterium]
MIIHVKTENEYKNLIKEGKVLVDFYASWCGPCRMLGEVIEEIENEVDVTIVKVDTDEMEFINICKENNIQSIPTLLLYENGTSKNKSVGFLPKDRLLNFIK